MNLETAFNRGDQVFFMKDNEIKHALIYSIDIKVTPKGTFVSYYLGNNNFSSMYEEKFTEGRLFVSKEVLKQSL